MFVSIGALLAEKIQGICLVKAAQLNSCHFSEAFPIGLLYVFPRCEENFHALRKACDKFVNVTFCSIDAVNDQQDRFFSCVIG